ncbi:sugar phosphate isomerase/epimerase [Granulicella sp. L60]|uniref:sugar phosphate isomerase/epimerase family protein n=1 Tax=Granulicella sp. L60 TaxID=1641866 RepID=UPI00131A7786|nr:sugar phosphate isomerase/epimerase family protein [Granulicella sp. L60]
MQSISRRSFLAAAATTATMCAAQPLFGMAAESKSPFNVAVITDEISQDFDHACSVAANEFGLQWVELRGMWNKSLQDLTEAEIAEAQKILSKYGLRVTDIASPLFKAHWPGAPKSQYGPKNDALSGDAILKHQDEVLMRSVVLAKQFKTDKVRCFDFWRLDDVAPYRVAIDAKLQEAADECGKQGILLVIENEFECNTATAREAARTLSAVPSPHFAMNWDPGNAVMRGEMDAFPGGWDLLPKRRICHCHVKNAVKNASGKVEWSPVDIGIIDWVAQFRALEKVGYCDAVSLETHWRGAGSSEESSRISWAGMRKALQDSGTL